MTKQNETKYIIFQYPNKFLWVMIITWPLGYLTTGYIHATSRTLFLVAGIIWSYEEIVHGVNWFRRILGLIVFLSLFFSIWKDV